MAVFTPTKTIQIQQVVTHHARRGRRKRIHRGRIPERVSIHERPQHIEKRDEFGHWEVDLMSFQKNTQHLLVIHERKTRFTVTFKLQSKSADETMAKLLQFFKSLPKGFVKSVTFDNGLEFSRHVNLRRQLQISTYFCDVYASWQKGGIENMNGRLRRDLPRKTDLYKLQDGDLEEIVLSHNLIPRHVLHGVSPLQTLSSHLGHSIIFLFNKGVALHL